MEKSPTKSNAIIVKRAVGGGGGGYGGGGGAFFFVSDLNSLKTELDLLNNPSSSPLLFASAVVVGSDMESPPLDESIFCNISIFLLVR
jgi:hypothetical protein